MTILIFMLYFNIKVMIVKIEITRHQKMPAVRRARGGFGDQNRERVR